MGFPVKQIPLHNSEHTHLRNENETRNGLLRYGIPIENRATMYEKRWNVIYKHASQIFHMNFIHASIK
jgi:hypothetical protein